jgi:hypothetical protein
MMRRFEAFLADIVRDIDTKKCVPEAMLRRSFEFMKENPNLVRLGAWAQLEGDAASWSGEMEASDGFSRMFSAAQEGGTGRKHLGPRLLTILMDGVNVFVVGTRETYLRLHEGTIEANKMDEEVLEAMVEVFLKGTLECARAN